MRDSESVWGRFQSPCELDPEVIETVDEGAYLREKVLFNSERDMAVVAYVLVPKDMKPGERRPAILACHGHGHGKDDICGIDHGERRRVSTIASLNYDYARRFAQRGYVVIAPDWRGFGERSLGGERGGKDSCDLLFIKGMLLGVNLLTLNIWDAMCSLTYLESRPEVDPERIGIVGLSYGGTMALFTAALDERVKCAVVSGYLNSLGSFALGLGNFCGVQIPAGLLKYGDLSDVGCLIAPRPLLIESGTQDPGFPIEASREAAARRQGVAMKQQPPRSATTRSTSSTAGTSGAAPRPTSGSRGGFDSASSADLTRIHRRTSLGTALEEASGSSSESGIMVLEQKPARKQGAPNRCCHRTNPTVSASSLTTIAWWPMPACSCRPPPAGHPSPAPGPAGTRRPSP